MQTFSRPGAVLHAGQAQKQLMSGNSVVLCPNCRQENTFGAQFCRHCGSDVILNNDAPQQTQRQYYITRIIKQGGQGAVYAGIDRADRQGTGKVYAIKELLDKFTDPRERAEATARFHSEAQLLQRLSHPRIPNVYDHFTDEGRHYLIMDFVRGDDLENILKQRGEPLPEHEILEWAYQISDVLAYLHQEGLIYRDVKPSNIMIDGDGGVKLVDFGIAKVFKPAERGTQIGTPGYAPPEQYQGMATPLSDIYALGATLHHLLTGRDPTEETPFSFPPARDLNPRLSERTNNALLKALKMKPEERFGSMSEFRAMLRPLVGSQTSTNPLRAQVRVAQPRPTAVNSPNVPSVPTFQGQAQPPAQAQSRQATPRRTTQPPVRPAAPPKPAAPPRKQQTQPGPKPASTPACAAPAQPAKRIPFQVVAAVLLLLSLGGFGAGVVFFPEALATIPGVQQVVEVFRGSDSGAPAGGYTPLQPVPLEYNIQVESGLDEATIRESFRSKYPDILQREHPGARLQGGTVSVIGEPVFLGVENGQERYRATVSGFAQLPVR